MAKYLVENRTFETNDKGICDNSANLIVNSAGYYSEDDQAKILPMILDRPEGRLDYLLCYVVRGQVELIIEDKHFCVKEGCFIIPPNTPHRYTNETLDSAYELYWVHFTGAQAKQIINKLKLDTAYNITIGCVDEIKNSIEMLVKEMAFKLTQFEMVAESLLLFILSLIVRKQSQVKNDINGMQIDSRIQKAMEYIYLYFRENISVKQLADVSQLSVSRFSALFKQDYGLFPLQYILYYRIKRACELLKNTEYSVSQIAEMCGFEDPLYFSRVFKKEMSICPSQYRSKINSYIMPFNHVSKTEEIDKI